MKKINTQTPIASTAAAIMSEIESRLYEEPILCPECMCITKTEYCYPIGDLYSGIIFGYFLYCPNCKERVYINQLGRPPWFDLSRPNRYTEVKDGG